MTSFGCCWYGGGGPPEPRLLEFLQGPGEDECGRIACGSGIVMEDECEAGVQNLGGRLVSMLMRAGILVGGVAVVLVGEMVVVVGIVFFEEWSLCVTEVES